MNDLMRLIKERWFTLPATHHDAQRLLFFSQCFYHLAANKPIRACYQDH